MGTFIIITVSIVGIVLFFTEIVFKKELLEFKKQAQLVEKKVTKKRRSLTDKEREDLEAKLKEAVAKDLGLK